MNTKREHGPDNAEFELTVAYNHAVETGLVYQGRSLPGISPDEVTLLYRRAYDHYRQRDRLAAERWARTVKHLSRALWHEAKISFLQGRTSELPFIANAERDAIRLHEYSDTTRDLLDSVSGHMPEGDLGLPVDMKTYLGRALAHLDTLKTPDLRHELLRAEHIKAAHEYGRVLECMELAIAAEQKQLKKSA
jgi:hypothetical protein